MTDKSVLTIATGKQVYVDMACNLAMSFLLWNDTSVIKFSLVTDCPQFVPQKLKENINVIQIPLGEIADGFSSKLYMDRFSYSKQNLFIDADCLVYGNLIPVFDKFKGHSVSVIGCKLFSGKDIGFCKDITQVMAATEIEYFPLLCGSIYYFEQGNLSSKIFNYAQSLLKSYEKIGLVPLRGKENEEPLMAIAMAKFNQEPVNDTGFIKADRMFYEFLDTNVLGGKARLWNNKKIPVPQYSTLKLATPLIVHFNESTAETFEYESEVIRLRKYFFENKRRNEANIYAFLTSVMPGKLIKMSKTVFRPFYRILFGRRKIKASQRE